MNRREFLSRSILTGGALIAFPSAPRCASAADDNIQLTVHGDQPLGAIAPNFIGLGYEISSIARPGLLSRSNAVYVQLVRALGARGVVRVGGNTSDYSSYFPTAPAVSAPKSTVVNDAMLRDLGGFLDATQWKLIWGLNLGSGSVSDAIAEAKAVSKFAGSRLLAFEIGDEPDLFPGEKHRPPNYNYQDWLADYRKYKTALCEQIPGIRFAGPDAALKTDWVRRFAADEGKDIALLTHHYYREGQNPASTIQKLLAPDPKLAPELEALRAASDTAKVPYRICEVNSFSGGGRPGVSDTMAAALWVLDYMFTLASFGCGGVNMETGVNQLGFISPYSPIGDDEQGHYMAKPEYYGMLAFSLAGKGELLKTQIGENSTQVKAYAVKQPGGAVALTVINKGDTAAGLQVSMTDLSLAGHASLVRLTAPAVNAKTGITLGEAEVSADGTWKAAQSETIAVKNGNFQFSVPAASAAILSIS